MELEDLSIDAGLQSREPSKQISAMIQLLQDVSTGIDISRFASDLVKVSNRVSAG